MTDKLTISSDHVYRIGDRVFPGTTDTIHAHVPPWHCDQFFLDRGTKVHDTIRSMLNFRLNWNEVDPEIVGRVRAVEKFLNDENIKPQEIEKKYASLKYQFAGTIDCIGFRGSEIVLCDWKGTISPEVEIQLGAYSLLVAEDSGQHFVKRGVAVETHDDGTYHCKWFTKTELRNAGNVFLAMLTVSGWKQKHKIKEAQV